MTNRLPEYEIITEKNEDGNGVFVIVDEFGHYVFPTRCFSSIEHAKAEIARLQDEDIKN